MVLSETSKPDEALPLAEAFDQVVAACTTPKLTITSLRI